MLKRTYRITEEQDKKVKRLAKQEQTNDNQIIRNSIDKYK